MDEKTEAERWGRTCSRSSCPTSISRGRDFHMPISQMRELRTMSKRLSSISQRLNWDQAGNTRYEELPTCPHQAGGPRRVQGWKSSLHGCTLGQCQSSSLFQRSFYRQIVCQPSSKCEQGSSRAPTHPAALPCMSSPEPCVKHTSLGGDRPSLQGSAHYGEWRVTGHSRPRLQASRCPLLLLPPPTELPGLQTPWLERLGPDVIGQAKNNRAGQPPSRKGHVLDADT
ncbi:uncharacterized protein LOC124903734 [Homo sapiens]|uniref:uncharacterized protein LOC124903734 n=1 Tax=Homo sapiens TaxID=9606 RepID=UPI0005D02B26|nr:uncharacterized protein LOC124903734 [Homo sapiens]